MQEISVILFGSIVSYKTKIRKTFCKQQFSHQDIRINPSQSSQYSQRILKHHTKNINFKIWDTAYRGGGHKSVSKFWRIGDCIIYVYEASRKQSFDDAMSFFKNKSKYPNRPVMLVEYILHSEKREIPQGRGAKFAQENGMMFQQIIDGSPQHVERMFQKLATEMPLWKSKNKLGKNDKDIYLSQILALQSQVRRLNQKIQDFEKFNEQSYKMYEKYKNLQLAHEEAIKKLRAYEKLVNSFEIHKEIYDVVSLYEKENLALKQTIEEIQDQFQKRQSKLIIRCRTLQQICYKFNNISTTNASKLDPISIAYNRYILMNCSEQSIEMAEKQAIQISRQENMSKLLQGLNSPSVQHLASKEQQHLILADDESNI